MANAKLDAAVRAGGKAVMPVYGVAAVARVLAHVPAVTAVIVATAIVIVVGASRALTR